MGWSGGGGGSGTGHKLKIKHEEKKFFLFQFSGFSMTILLQSPPQHSFKKLARNIGKIIVYSGTDVFN